MRNFQIHNFLGVTKNNLGLGDSSELKDSRKKGKIPLILANIDLTDVSSQSQVLRNVDLCRISSTYQVPVLARDWLLDSIVCHKVMKLPTYKFDTE